jgi:hypothetical protein
MNINYQGGKLWQNQKNEKRRKLPYGVCELSVGSAKYMQHIYGAIQEYAGIDRPEWLDL